jgi:hypothetical protein
MDWAILAVSRLVEYLLLPSGEVPHSKEIAEGGEVLEPT